jgi:hypothetical protein
MKPAKPGKITTHDAALGSSRIFGIRNRLHTATAPAKHRLHSFRLCPASVMPGLVPGIPMSLARCCTYERDGRDKPGHDAIV